MAVFSYDMFHCNKPSIHAILQGQVHTGGGGVLINLGQILIQK